MKMDYVHRRSRKRWLVGDLMLTLSVTLASVASMAGECGVSAAEIINLCTNVKKKTSEYYCRTALPWIEQYLTMDSKYP